jgi:hypothetical protein
MRLLGIDNYLINWVINFLMQRRQRVKLGPVLSDWEFLTVAYRRVNSRPASFSYNG